MRMHMPVLAIRTFVLMAALNMTSSAAAPGRIAIDFGHGWWYPRARLHFKTRGLSLSEEEEAELELRLK